MQSLVKMNVVSELYNTELYNNGIKLLEKSEYIGNPNVAHRLDNMFYNKSRVKRDFKKSIKWYQVADRLGNIFHRNNGEYS